MGQAGGKSRSAAKTAAAQANGLRGGRPRIYPPCPSPYANHSAHAFIPSGPRTWEKRIGRCRLCFYRPRRLRGAHFKVRYAKRRGMRVVGRKYVPKLFARATAALQNSGAGIISQPYQIFGLWQDCQNMSGVAVLL